jgi:indolepyruvate ferredoxin oxidoreductase
VGSDRPYTIVAVGIGGTGVVTLNQIVATAAWSEGLVVRGLDQTGLSQKGGPVVSHLVLSDVESAGSNAVGAGSADLYLALDPVAAADERFVSKVVPDRTATVATSTLVPTISMVLGADRLTDAAAMLATLAARSRPDGWLALDAAGAAEAAFGDAATANVVLLGAAYQAGRLPLRASSVESAIRANGVAVDVNLAAFRLGRRLAHDPQADRAAHRRGELDHQPSSRATEAAERMSAGRAVPAFAQRRTADLVDYQGVRLAHRYLDLVTEVAAAEGQTTPGSTQLTETVAAAYFKLLAYKDEYEVARLHLLPAFRDALDEAGPRRRRSPLPAAPAGAARVGDAPEAGGAGGSRRAGVRRAARDAQGARHPARRLRPHTDATAGAAPGRRLRTRHPRSAAGACGDRRRRGHQVCCATTGYPRLRGGQACSSGALRGRTRSAPRAPCVTDGPTFLDRVTPASSPAHRPL